MPPGDIASLLVLIALAAAQLLGVARGSRAVGQALVGVLFISYVVVAGLFLNGAVFASSETPGLFVVATSVVIGGLAGGVFARRARNRRE